MRAMNPAVSVNQSNTPPDERYSVVETFYVLYGESYRPNSNGS